MADPPTGTARTAATELFDKYTLPKVALAVILTASLMGTWVTGQLAGRWALVVTLLKWSYFVSLGVLTGGLVWKHLFVRPEDLGTDASEYCAEMYARFDRIAAGALVVVALSGQIVFAEYIGVLGWAPLVVVLGVLFAAWLGVTALTTRNSAPVDEQFRSPAGLAALALALAVVVLTAVAEVALRGFDPIAATVRVLHLLAFAAWIGGAVWNIFVAVPTGQKRPTTAVIQAAGEQLERFRWAVRFIIPTLLLTGLYQAVDGLGTALPTYVQSLVGLVILAKLGFMGLLFVIFKTCPMWRACSPIDGVCDLDDLGGGPQPGTSSEGTADD